MKLFHSLELVYLKIINWFLSEPKRLIRFAVLSICSVIVFFQLWECVMKLMHPPISTHSDFKLNETMHYPAVTLCRNPAFKRDVLEKFNLSYHPSITSAWQHFSFNDLTLSEIYKRATFSKEEVFGPYALDGYQENVEIVQSVHFSHGRCYTLKPKKTTYNPWKESGYVVTVKHDFDGDGDADAKGIRQGWNIFLHEPKEDFTEFGIATSGRVENLFLNVQEEMELKVAAHHYLQFRGRGQICSDDTSKSTSLCREKCIWHLVEMEVQCSGPWVRNRSTIDCHSYEDIRRMTVAYKNITEINDMHCGCLKPCDTTIYSSFVMNRKPLKRDDEPYSKVYIYYTSKMVTNLEERSSYDSSQFLADMGGSLGFLLGLSVIGLIILMEKILGYLFLDKWAEDFKERRRVKEKMKEREIVREANAVD